MTGPRGDVIGAKRSLLLRDVNGIVETLRRLAEPTQAHGGEIEITGGPDLSLLALREPPKKIRLDCRLRDHVFQPAVQAVKIVAGNMIADVAVVQRHRRGAE